MEIFYQRLLETVAWCSTHKLWTPDLRPLGFEEGNLISQRDEERIQTVHALAERRSQLLRAQNTEVTLFVSEVNRGGLIAFSPEMSLWDGAAEGGSNGFFDSSNTPPWDTWITFVVEDENSNSTYRGWRSYLLAWVPPENLELVNAGIEVNPEECINWIHYVPAPFIKTLIKEWNLD